MRVLFLLLLLANLLFLAWTRWVVPAAQVVPAAPALDREMQPIRLQSEAMARPEAVRASAGEAVGPVLPAASCVSVGPFIDPVHADAAAVQLERLGFTSRRRVAQDEVRVGYWVRVPDLATPEDATNALAMLRAAGLSDAYVETEGQPGNTVSIGVYADPRRAAEAADAAAKAGFSTATSDRLRPLEVQWLDVDRQANGSLPALEALGAPPEGGLPYDLRACPAANEPAAGVTPPANPAPAPVAAAAPG